MQEVLTTLSGQTVAFQGNGRKLGYPTANIRVATPLEDGVYFGYADLAEHHHQPALIFIGTPVTVGDTERRVEAHLLDITDRDYYDEQLQVEIRHFHRPNQKLASLDELKAIMHQDEQAAREWFAKQEAA